MKRIAITVVMLCMFVSIAFAAQNKNATAPAKPKAAPVDCSTVDDATLVANVKDKLSKTPSLKDAAINIAASNGAVTLTGSLGKGQLKGVATNQAKRVPCVQKVVNQITVPKSDAPPKNAKSKNANQSQ
ncbi:MAG TPA: BON domain-containing protein [Blastocatellia bacterium]|nr:BON domain-containing protein [Blastocatellia bacterium]